MSRELRKTLVYIRCIYMVHKKKPSLKLHISFDEEKTLRRRDTPQGCESPQKTINKQTLLCLGFPEPHMPECLQLPHYLNWWSMLPHSNLSTSSLLHWICTLNPPSPPAMAGLRQPLILSMFFFIPDHLVFPLVFPFSLALSRSACLRLSLSLSVTVAVLFSTLLS